MEWSQILELLPPMELTHLEGTDTECTWTFYAGALRIGALVIDGEDIEIEKYAPIDQIPQLPAELREKVLVEYAANVNPGHEDR
ncbi:hypothetical protein [Nocardia wallacei]|uniref:hypothetical protein n=1 Tax=Nocardia wallacei TaxID=480035 RepID=UPI0024542A0F|nr:hypothetical protein [Nocardia wallacei]